MDSWRPIADVLQIPTDTVPKVNLSVAYGTYYEMLLTSLLTDDKLPAAELTARLAQTLRKLEGSEKTYGPIRCYMHTSIQGRAASAILQEGNTL